MSTPRVMLVHNAYRQRGGEDSVVEAEAALLRSRGHEVIEFRRHNDELAGRGRFAAARDTLWSHESHQRALELIDTAQPQLVHVHNTFALISPSLYWACAQRRVPVVQTLHNFRLACPQALMLREGRVCEDCLGRTPWPALRHGCYRGSRAHSAVLGGMITLHRALGTWRNKVTRYIALNRFCLEKFVAAGLPRERLRVKPNFVDFAAPAPTQARDGLLFVGRLAEEKGVATLAEAMRRTPQATLSVLGSGPLEQTFAGLANVRRLGSQPLDQVQGWMNRCGALLMPSIWYENFPRTLVEAYAAGLPVIASRIGALAELVEHGVTGLLFEPGDAADLARCIEWARAHPQRLAEMGRRARARYELLYTPQRNYDMLMEIYRDALAATA